MAINTRAVYFYNTSKHLTKQGSLTYDTGTDKYTYSATEANINQGDISNVQLVIALPPAMFSGGMPMVVTLSPKGYKSGLLSMSAATWTIIENTVETNYPVFYISMTLVSWTFTAGKNAFMVGYLTNGAYDNLDLARYTVQNGVDNFEELDADVYAEIYASLSAVFSDLSARVIVLEDEMNLVEGDISDIFDGTQTVKKAEQDASGNVITTTYATKTEDSLKIPLAYLDTDGSLVENSDLKIATQKAIKTYVDTQNNSNVKLDDNNIFLGNQQFGQIGSTYVFKISSTGVIGIYGGVDYATPIIQITSSGIYMLPSSFSDPDDVTDNYVLPKVAAISLINSYISAHNSSESAHGKGDANGIAELDENGKVPLAQIYGALNDIQDAYIVGATEYESDWLSLTEGGNPLTPESGNWYIVQTDGEYKTKGYRWSGSVYVLVTSTLVLGETSNTAYRGDRGATAYTHSQLADGTNPHATTFANLVGKPTTLDGYGITDAYDKDYIDALIAYFGWSNADVVTLANAETISYSSVSGFDLLRLTYIDTPISMSGTPYGYQYSISMLIKPSQLANDGDRVFLNLRYVTSALKEAILKSGWLINISGTLTYQLTGGGGYVGEDTLKIESVSMSEQIAEGIVTTHAGNTLVNEDLNVQADINELDGKIEDNTTDIGTNASAIAVNSLDIAEHEQRIDEAEETLRKSLSGDTTSTATGTDIISLGKDVAPAPLKLQIDGMLLKATDLMSAGFNKRARSIGKNLLDINTTIASRYAAAQVPTGAVTISKSNNSVTFTTVNTYDGVGWLFKVKPSTAYIPSTANLTFNRFNITYYNNEDVQISETTGTTALVTFTTPASCVKICITLANSVAGTYTVTNPQLELGSTATAYEPYVHSDMFIKGNAQGYILPNLTKDTIEFRDGKGYYVKRLTVVAVTGVVAVNTTNYPTALTGGQFINYLTAGGSETGVIGTNSTSGDGTLVYAIATPITTEIEARGILYGYPNGTVLIDDIMENVALYSTSAVIDNSSYPITALESIVKFDVNGVETALAVSGATIAGDGLSFTHTGLTAGDYVYFTYYYGDNVRGLVTVTYYDSKVVVTDSVTATVYKITPAIASGVLTWTLTAI